MQGEARKESSLRCVTMSRAVSRLSRPSSILESEDIEEGVFEEGTCVAHACLSLFWDVGLFEHLFLAYIQRGNDRDV
jgi:hypothetical protein